MVYEIKVHTRKTAVQRNQINFFYLPSCWNSGGVGQAGGQERNSIMKIKLFFFLSFSAYIANACHANNESTLWGRGTDRKKNVKCIVDCGKLQLHSLGRAIPKKKRKCNFITAHSNFFSLKHRFLAWRTHTQRQQRECMAVRKNPAESVVHSYAEFFDCNSQTQFGIEFFEEVFSARESTSERAQANVTDL